MLTVTLFGQADVTWNGAAIDLLRRQTRALFYRLAVQHDSISREQLCFLFWPDVADVTARRNLTRLLTHLRRALPDPDILVTTPDAVSLNARIIISDAVDFEQYLRQAERQTDPDLLKQAVDLYLGPFLSGFSFPDCAEYDNWLANKRRAFERQYLHALTTLIDHAVAQQEHRTAIDYAHRYLEHDELDETVHRRLIELYAAAGDRNAAHHQFETCATILERELGVDPLPETRAAYEAALAERPLPTPHPVPPLAWATLLGLDLPIVGRDDALTQLENCYQKAAAGSGSVVLISGEAGIGKSRLLQEFATRWEAEALVLAGAGQPGEQALPYLPVTQILRRGIHLNRGDLRVDPVWLAEASLVLPELRTLYPNLTAPLQMDAQQARTRLFEALTRIILALAQAGHPLLLCFDDLHWTDSATLDWIAYLAQSIRHSRILLIGTYRQEEPDSVAPLRHHLLRQGSLCELCLDGLSPDAIYQLLRHADRSLQDGNRLAKQLHLTTSGNAFFCLETVQAMLEEHGTLNQFRAPDDLILPQTLADAIAVRLRPLSPLARQLLEAGAVLGSAFAYSVVQQTAGRSEQETVEGLNELAERRLLRADAEFDFHHDILRRTVYQGIARWRRQLMHRRAAETLAVYQPEDVAALAWHFDQAETEPDRAVYYYLQAGDQALRLFVFQEAIGYFTRAVQILERLPDTHKRTQMELALRFGLLNALAADKGFAAVEGTPHHQRTLVLCRRLGDHNQLYRALNSLWGHHLVRAEHEEALGYARQSLDLAQQMGMPALIAEAKRTVDESLHVLGKLGVPSQSYTMDGYPIDGTIDPALHKMIDHRQIDYHCLAARFLWIWGYPDRAIHQAWVGLTHAQRIGNPFTVAFALCFVIMLHHFRREVDAARVPLRSLTQIVQEHHYPFLQAASMVYEGWALLLNGQPAQAAVEIQAGISAWRATGAGYWLPYHLGLLAEAWAQAGDVPRGLDALATAQVQMAQTGERFWEPELLRLQAMLLQQMASQAQEEVECCLLQAIASARIQQAKSLELRATVSLARLWQVQGKRQEARQWLLEIYGWFTEGFDTPDLKEARALLESL